MCDLQVVDRHHRLVRRRDDQVVLARARQVEVPRVDPIDRAIHELRTGKLRVDEARTLQVAPGQVGTGQVRPAQARLPEVRARQVGVDEPRRVQVRIDELCPDGVDALEVRVGQEGAAQVGVTQIDARQVRRQVETTGPPCVPPLHVVDEAPAELEVGHASTVAPVGPVEGTRDDSITPRAARPRRQGRCEQHAQQAEAHEPARRDIVVRKDTLQ